MEVEVWSTQHTSMTQREDHETDSSTHSQGTRIFPFLDRCIRPLDQVLLFRDTLRVTSYPLLDRVFTYYDGWPQETDRHHREVRCREYEDTLLGCLGDQNQGRDGVLFLPVESNHFCTK